jgi:predicted esterase
MKHRVAAAVAVLLLAAAGCGSSHRPPTAAPAWHEVHMTSRRGQPELLVVPGGGVRGLVVFIHGYGGNEQQMMSYGLLPLSTSLLKAGFALASSAAHGDNFGDKASVTDQSDLVADADQRLHDHPPVDVVGVSMGGVDALEVAAARTLPGLRRELLLFPVTDTIAFVGSQFAGAIREAYGGRTGAALIAAMAVHDPARLPAAAYRPYAFWFWHSPTDQTVPFAQTQAIVARLQGAGVDARLSLLNGGHGDLSRLPVAAVVAFFEG